MQTEEESIRQSEAAKSDGNESKTSFPIIVIGASIGGFSVIRTIIKALPEHFEAAILIVWHMPAVIEGIMPKILTSDGRLPATFAISGEPIEPSHIYIAPPDYHLIVEDEQLLLTHGPKENRFRPAVDPLFRSAAYHHGSRVIGIILSGALDDGTAGLRVVKHYGGTAIVQEPAEAEATSMPASAIRQVAVDHVVPSTEIAQLLIELVNNKKEQKTVPMPQDKLTGVEISIAKQRSGMVPGIMEMGEYSPYTCPECHGVLVRLKEGSHSRFRCHTGHAYTAAALLAAVSETIEESLYVAMRGIEESIMLLNHMGNHHAEANEPRLAAAYFRKAKEASDRVASVRSIAISHGQLPKENIRAEAE